MSFPLFRYINDEETMIPVLYSNFHANGGVVQIDDEKVFYTKSTPTGLLDCIRGYDDTVAVEHLEGAEVTLISNVVPEYSFGGHRLTNVADPIANQDAATKSYVDSVPGAGATIEASEVNSETASDGQVLTADGLGGAAWETPAGGALPDEIQVTGLNEVLIDGNLTLSPGYAVKNTEHLFLESAQSVIATGEGFLPPVMTTVARDAITNPPAGLQVYDSTLNAMVVYDGTEWKVLGAVDSVTATQINSGSALDGEVLTATGSGETVWLSLVRPLPDFSVIGSPVTGMLAFDYNFTTLMFYDGGTWKAVAVQP